MGSKKYLSCKVVRTRENCCEAIPTGEEEVRSEKEEDVLVGGRRIGLHHEQQE